MAAAASSDRARLVHVWHATVDAFIARGPDAHTRALDLLGPAERARHARFRHDADRHMFLLGRVMARTSVGHALGVAPGDWPWREGLRGRPEIDRPDCTVSFNLAHSSGLVVCALSHTGAVGVDIEHRGRAPLEHALVARCCAADEAADVDAQGERWRDRFLMYWTLKESYLKATGLGVTVHLPEVRFRLGPEPRAEFTGTLEGADAGWRFQLQPVAPHHYAAVAVPPTDHDGVEVRHLSFPEEWWP